MTNLKVYPIQRLWHMCSPPHAKSGKEIQALTTWRQKKTQDKTENQIEKDDSRELCMHACIEYKQINGHPSITVPNNHMVDWNL